MIDSSGPKAHAQVRTYPQAVGDKIRLSKATRGGVIGDLFQRS